MTDPTRIRSIAVHRADVATALEATLRSERDVVLRLTPPFAGRMRARIHDRSDELDRCADPGAESGESEAESGESGAESGDGDPASGGAAIHIPAGELVDDPPAYPEPDETLDGLEPPGSAGYDVEKHRERHAAAVEAWRVTVAESIVDRVELTVDDCVESESVEPSNGATAHEVEVLPLG